MAKIWGRKTLDIDVEQKPLFEETAVCIECNERFTQFYNVLNLTPEDKIWVYYDVRSLTGLGLKNNIVSCITAKKLIDNSLEWRVMVRDDFKHMYFVTVPADVIFASNLVTFGYTLMRDLGKIQIVCNGKTIVDMDYEMDDCELQLPILNYAVVQLSNDAGV